MLETSPWSTIAPINDPAPSKASLQRWTHGLVNRIVMAIDAVGLMGATFAYWERSSLHRWSFTWLQAGAIAVIMVIGFHAVMGWTHSYRVERYTRMRWSLTDVAIGLLSASIPATLIIAAFLPDAATNSDWLLGWMGASCAGLLLGRCLARLLVYLIQKKLCCVAVLSSSARDPKPIKSSRTARSRRFK
jgi:hypothetical protein